MAGGAPTLYKSEYCLTVVEFGKRGKSITWMACALDVAKETVYEWARVHPEFSVALSRARAECQAFWEDLGEKGVGSRDFNSAVWAKNMACRFRDDWTERREVTGADGQPLLPQSDPLDTARRVAFLLMQAEHAIDAEPAELLLEPARKLEQKK